MAPNGNTVTFGHDHVNQEQIHPPVGLAQGVEGFGASRGLKNPESLLSEDPVCDATRDRLVIDNQNRCGRMG
jgi:hypothetical protein